MESINKFKALTIIIICMFVFVVAAIYSNTKDATEGKLQTKQENANTAIDNTMHNDNFSTTSNDNDLSTQIEFLTRRIDEMSERINNSNSNKNSSQLNCNIYGSMTPNGIEQMSADAAIQEAQVNNNNIVLNCSLQN